MPKAVNPALKDIEQLGQLQCTYDEVAAFFSVDVRTVKRWMQKPPIREAFTKGQSKGRMSLRRAQFQAALAGDRTMLVWLGKQLLGQKDVVEQVTFTGTMADKRADVYRNLSEDDLRQLEDIMDKAAAVETPAD